MTWWQIALVVYALGAVIMTVLVYRAAHRDINGGCSTADAVCITIFCTLFWPVMVYGVLQRRFESREKS